MSKCYSCRKVNIACGAPASRLETKKEVVVLVMMCLGGKRGALRHTDTEIIVIEEGGVGRGRAYR